VQQAELCITMRKNTSFQTLTGATLGLIAARFQVLGEASRLKLIIAIGNDGKNVSQLIVATGLSQANASKHLKILSDSGILARRKKGIYVYYSRADSTVINLCKVAGASLQKRLKNQAKAFNG
jgi:DNA-binding transcriptional ArsR family regulator